MKCSPASAGPLTDDGPASFQYSSCDSQASHPLRRPRPAGGTSGGFSDLHTALHSRLRAAAPAPDASAASCALHGDDVCSVTAFDALLRSLFVSRMLHPNCDRRFPGWALPPAVPDFSRIFFSCDRLSPRFFSSTYCRLALEVIRELELGLTSASSQQRGEASRRDTSVDASSSEYAILKQLYLLRVHPHVPFHFRQTLARHLVSAAGLTKTLLWDALEYSVDAIYFIMRLNHAQLRSSNEVGAISALRTHLSQPQRACTFLSLGLLCMLLSSRCMPCLEEVSQHHGIEPHHSIISSSPPSTLHSDVTQYYVKILSLFGGLAASAPLIEVQAQVRQFHSCTCTELSATWINFLQAVHDEANEEMLMQRTLSLPSPHTGSDLPMLVAPYPLQAVWSVYYAQTKVYLLSSGEQRTHSHLSTIAEAISAGGGGQRKASSADSTQPSKVLAVLPPAPKPTICLPSPSKDAAVCDAPEAVFFALIAIANALHTPLPIVLQLLCLLEDSAAACNGAHHREAARGHRDNHVRRPGKLKRTVFLHHLMQVCIVQFLDDSVQEALGLLLSVVSRCDSSCFQRSLQESIQSVRYKLQISLSRKIHQVAWECVEMARFVLHAAGKHAANRWRGFPGNQQRLIQPCARNFYPRRKQGLLICSPNGVLKEKKKRFLYRGEPLDAPL